MPLQEKAGHIGSFRIRGKEQLTHRAPGRPTISSIALGESIGSASVSSGSVPMSSEVGGSSDLETFRESVHPGVRTPLSLSQNVNRMRPQSESKSRAKIRGPRNVTVVRLDTVIFVPPPNSLGMELEVADLKSELHRMRELAVDENLLRNRQMKKYKAVISELRASTIPPTIDHCIYILQFIDVEIWTSNLSILCVASREHHLHSIDPLPGSLVILTSPTSCIHFELIVCDSQPIDGEVIGTTCVDLAGVDRVWQERCATIENLATLKFRIRLSDC